VFFVYRTFSKVLNVFLSSDQWLFQSCDQIFKPEKLRLNVKFRLFSILARKTALYLAVHRKITPPARKSGLFMATTGTKHAGRALWRSSRSLL
jgi:hypothetical protein